MTDRPILFSAPMVRALRDGRKTQTRRIVKPQPTSVGYTPLVSFNHGRPEISFGPDDTDARGIKWWRCPYGQAGDRLWVREAFSYETLDVDRDGFMPPWYWADGNPSSGDFTKPKPSIHMPRWASRLTLAVTGVRVERLQDISEADSLAEGIVELRPADKDGGRHLGIPGLPADAKTAARAYRALWEHINGAGSWDANPWIWAVSFEVATNG